MSRKLPPLSEMERIEQSMLGEKMDEILERIDKEDIAFVITEGGRNKAVICPYRWFEESFPEEIGGTIVSAIRYELSAESENADAVRQFAMKHRVVLDEHTRSEVIREIEHHMAGMDSEVLPKWQELLDQLRDEMFSQDHPKTP